jgi:hypothetical protein
MSGEMTHHLCLVRPSFFDAGAEDSVGEPIEASDLHTALERSRRSGSGAA